MQLSATRGSTNGRWTRRHVRYRWGAAALAGLVALLTVSVPVVARGSTGLTMTGFSPTVGPVGTAVTITGTGFTSRDIVKFNGTPASASKANSAGTTLKVSVPAFATSGAVTVTNPSTGQTVGLPGAAFQVTRGIHAAPTHVWAGGQLVLSGSALSPNQQEEIQIARQPVGVATTDAFGNFQVGVSVPWSETPGKTTISVFDQTGPIFSVLFIVGDWPQSRHDELGTGYDTFETALLPTTVAKLNQKWNVNGTEFDNLFTTTQATVAGGLAFSGGHTFNDTLAGYPVGYFIANNAATGAQLWRFSLGTFAYPSTPAVSNGVMYGTVSWGVLYALDAKLGTEQWSAKLPIPTGQEVLCCNTPPTIANGVVYVAANGLLDALDATSGKLLWDSPVATKMISESPPVVSNGVVIVGGSDGNLYGLNATTGSLVWSKPGGGLSSPAITNGVVYMGASNGIIYARNVSTGSLVWSFKPGAGVGVPAVAQGTVYVGSADGKLYARNASTGASEWSAPLNPGTAPAIAHGVVYVGTTDGKVHAVNAATGTDLWSALPTNGILAGPVVANGMVYATSNFDCSSGCSSTLYAYGL